MIKHYKEKHLQATRYKIENVIEQQNFLIKNKWKVIGFGVLITIWAPTYRSQGPLMQTRKSLVEKEEYSYLELMLLCAIVYIVFCLLYHFSSLYQDRKELKRLRNLEKNLEEEISDLN
ncbi:hypothetical protein [Tenacibaculum ovolyticum]|uniref:hypothetical protein n=1 Tax=Tenacibaculum ovolyticum TaxID=104270 RepID=UPI001F2AB1BE|nr:hypothetical protein [Tenacibaculum ovolyticum]